MSQDSHASPRVNSTRLPDYVGRVVRITGKVVEFSNNHEEVVIQASDKGQIRVKGLSSAGGSITSTYIEIIGIVTSNDSVKAHVCVTLGQELDLGLVDFVVEKWHDPRFAKMF